MSSTPQESTHSEPDSHRVSSQAHSDGQHGAGSSSTPALSASAAEFVPPPSAPPAVQGATAKAAAGSPASAVAQAGHGRGGGRQGRGRDGSLSRELQGSQAGARQHSIHQGAGRGGGGRGSARQHANAAAGSPAISEPRSAASPAARQAASAGDGLLGSSPGRRGVAANHLLGFQTRRDAERLPGGPGRGSSGGRGPRSGGGGRGAPPRRPPPKPQPYDRNKFLQANFRFLVSDAVDVKRFEADPDRMLEWEDVVQVEMLSSAPVRCPITLDERPFCPQITPCGHVFSFPAIIGHLVAHGGPELRKSAPCPLCYTQIAARELRLVQVHRVTAPAIGEAATFQLLKRPKDGINPEAVQGLGAVQHNSQAGMPLVDLAQSQAAPAASEVPGKLSWKAGSGGRKGGAAALGSLSAELAGAGALAGTACNRFSKFSLVSDSAALSLMVAEAQRLAAYAAQVTAEGGLEAAYEAPNVYSAIDALAARARAATERRQRLLLEAADPLAQDALLSPEEAGQQASAAVKGATTAALSAAALRREQAAAANARDQQFPSLAATAAGGMARSSRVAAPSVLPSWPRAAAEASSVAPPAGPSAGHQPAFSDDEEGQGGAGTSPTAAQAAGASRQPRSAAMPIVGAAAGSAGAGPAARSGGILSPGAAAAAAELSSSVRSTGGMLGSSPGDGGAGGTGAGGTDVFFYQSADGQWLFLCPLNLRVLLAHFGSYAACPPTLTAKVLEMEDVVQSEASRRRMRVLAHLPITATFRLCEVDLSGLLPPESLAPFADELAQREKKRAQRAKQEARRLKQERAAAAAAAAAAANTGLSVAELRAMPLPSASLLPAGMEQAAAEDVAAVAEQDESGEGGQGDEVPPTPPQPGVSFAAIARDGFAATGPSLGSQAEFGPALGGQLAAAAAAAAPRGAWGLRPASAPPPPSWGPASGAANPTAGAAAAQQLAGLQVSSGGGKGGKKKIVLFGGAQRKY